MRMVCSFRERISICTGMNERFPSTRKNQKSAGSSASPAGPNAFCPEHRENIGKHFGQSTRKVKGSEAGPAAENCMQCIKRFNGRTRPQNRWRLQFERLQRNVLGGEKELTGESEFGGTPAERFCGGDGCRVGIVVFL